jgi:hypothetical protein
MGNPTFSTKLDRDFPREPDEDDLDDLREQPADLLNWVVARLMLGEDPPKKAPAFFKHQVDLYQKKQRGDLPLWPVTRWTNLAAISELLGQSGKGHAARAIEALPAAAKKTDWERGAGELVSCGIALHLCAGDAAGVAAWREKRLRQPFDDIHAAEMFYLLYMSGPGAKEDDLERLALEATHVRILALRGFVNQQVGPIVLALAARAAAEGKTAASVLRGAAHRLDAAVYGSAGDPSARLDFGAPSFEIQSRDGQGVLRMTVQAQGSGALRVGPEIVQPLTTHLASNLEAYRDATRERAEAKKLKAILGKPEGKLEAVLSFNPSTIAIEGAEQAALARRFAAAFEHTWAAVEGVACGGVLSFEPLAARGR